MIRYKLDATTTTNIPEIDAQHKSLFDEVNSLTAALAEGEGKAKVSGIIEFLDNYVKAHFKTEEDLMMKSKYPDFLTHKKSHELFRQNVADLRKELNEKGASSHLAILVQHEIGDWFMNHIRTIDMKYVPYLKDRA